MNRRVGPFVILRALQRVEHGARARAIRIARWLRGALLSARLRISSFFSSFALLLHTSNLYCGLSRAFPTHNGLSSLRGARVTLSLLQSQLEGTTESLTAYCIWERKTLTDFLQLVSISWNENVRSCVADVENNQLKSWLFSITLWNCCANYSLSLSLFLQHKPIICTHPKTKERQKMTITRRYTRLGD